MSLRTFLFLGYRLVLVVLLVTFFAFATLDQPVLRSLYQSFESLRDAFKSYFDFLTNVHKHTDTLTFVSRAYLRTMLLLLTSVVLGSVIGVGLGLFSGLRPGSRLAGAASYISFLGMLTPSFLLGIFVMLAFVRYISPWFGVRFVLLDPNVDILDPRRLIAPSLVLAARPLAFMTQVTIGALQEVIYRDYVRTAYAKGLRYDSVLFRHILPNIALPVLTALNSSFFYALSSIFVIEWLFNWQGVGFYLLESVLARDSLRASYLLVSIAVTLFLINTLIKLAIRRIDRRVAEMETVLS